MNAWSGNVSIVDDSVSTVTGHCYDYGKFVYVVHIDGQVFRHTEFGSATDTSPAYTIARGLANLGRYVERWFRSKHRREQALDRCWRD